MKIENWKNNIKYKLLFATAYFDIGRIVFKIEKLSILATMRNILFIFSNYVSEVFLEKDFYLSKYLHFYL